METSVLEELGFTKSEINVYLALLELGKSSAGNIAIKAQVASSKIYENLDRLMTKGLVSYIIESGVKYYEAVEPSRIMDYAKEKEEELKKQQNKLKDLIPNLKEKQLLSKYKSEAKIYRGIKGLHSAFYGGLDMLNGCDEFLSYGVIQSTKEKSRFFLKWGIERERKNIKAKMIFHESAKEMGDNETKKLKFTKIKYVNDYLPTAVNILGDRVILFPKESSKNFIIIVIDNKEVADSFRTQFNMLWNKDVSVVKGFDLAEKEFNLLLDDIGKGGECLAIGAAFGKSGFDENYLNFFKKFRENLHEKKIISKLLLEQNVVNINKTSLANIYPKENISKFLPYKTSSPVSINIGNNKTLFFVQSKEPTTIIIDNKEVTESFKSQFDSLWNQETISQKGQKNVELFYESIIEESKPEDEFILFASKPKSKIASNYNIDFIKKLVKKIRRVRLIYYENSQEIKDRVKQLKELGCEAKIIDTKESLPVSTMVVGDNIVIVIWDEEPQVIKYKNKIVANSYRQNFNLLWNEN